MKDKNLDRLLKRIEAERPINHLTETEKAFFDTLKYWENVNRKLYMRYAVKYIETINKKEWQ